MIKLWGIMDAEGNTIKHTQQVNLLYKNKKSAENMLERIHEDLDWYIKNPRGWMFDPNTSGFLYFIEKKFIPDNVNKTDPAECFEYIKGLKAVEVKIVEVA